VSGGGGASVHGVKSSEGTPQSRLERVAEFGLLATTTMSGGWAAEHMVHTDGAAWLGALVGLGFGAYLLRTWEDR
jgi:hypothetical protein